MNDGIGGMDGTNIDKDTGVKAVHRGERLISEV